MNRVELMGRLGGDCDVRYTQSGTCIVSGSVATTRSVSRGEGKYEDETTWVDFTVWGNRGKAFADHHQKGSQCLLVGRLTEDKWKDKETGAPRRKMKVTVEDWFFVGEKKVKTAEPTPESF